MNTFAPIVLNRWRHIVVMLLLCLSSLHTVADESAPGNFSDRSKTLVTAPADDYRIEAVSRALQFPPQNQAESSTDLLELWGGDQWAIIAALVGLGIIIGLLWLLARKNRQLSANEQRLTETIAEQQAILAAIPELMYEMDLGGRYLNIWAQHAQDLTESKSKLLNQKVTDVMPAEQADIILQALQQAYVEGQSHGQEMQQETIDGYKWFELSTSIKDTGDAEPHFIMLSRDITDRKQAERSIQALSQRYRGLFENMADGVVVYRVINDAEDFEIVDFNKGAESIEGLSRQQVIGKRASKVFPGLEAMGLLDVFRRVWSSGQAQTLAASFYHDERLSGWRENFVYKLASGEVVAIYRDVTARKQAEIDLRESEQQKQQILNSIPDLMWLKDKQGVYLACNPEFERFLGAREQQIMGNTDYDFVERSLADFFREHDIDVIKAGKAIMNEEWITYASDNRRALLEMTRTPFLSSDGAIIGVLGTGHDITERYRYEKRQRLAASVFQHSQEGIIITDAQNIIIDVNPACCHLTGYSRDELIGSNPQILSSGRQSEQFYRELWKTLSQQGHWQGELFNRKKGGEIFTELLSIDEVRDQRNELQYYVAVFSDISYLKKQEQALQHMAYSDALTGLPNRLLLHDRMQQAIRQAQRHDSLVAVCYLDLDGFKPINDQYGHEAGDEVLVTVSARLQQVLRDEDTVARLGGDEFVLLAQDIKSVRELESMLERVLARLSEPYPITEQQSAVVTASIGIALYPLDDADPDTLLRHADQAMYMAKKQGKNGYCYFDTGAEQRALQHQHLFVEIERALANDEFELYYQPKVNMRSGQVIGAEALIRWNHPERGLLLPGDFLPQLESNPLIVEIGNWVIRQALTQLQRFRAQGCGLKISINIAVLHIEQDDFVESVQNCLQPFSDLTARDIEFEILESAALHDIQRVSRVMHECDEMGIDFALDDFGTGYSSLTYLKQLPAKVLKIDQSFIRDLLQDPEDIVITEGILGMARAFDRQVIAEGVETVDHGAMLLSMGCELGQGYGIARPMPGSQLMEWARQFKEDERWANLRRTVRPEIDTTLLMLGVEHQKMVTRVINAINNKALSLIPEQLEDPERCALGKWLQGEGVEIYGENPVFQQLFEKHEYMHALFHLAAEQIAQDKTSELEQTREKLNQSRHQVFDRLSQLHKLKL